MVKFRDTDPRLGPRPPADIFSGWRVEPKRYSGTPAEVGAAVRRDACVEAFVAWQESADLDYDSPHGQGFAAGWEAARVFFSP